jgi:hypothetical protein
VSRLARTPRLYGFTVIGSVMITDVIIMSLGMLRISHVKLMVLLHLQSLLLSHRSRPDSTAIDSFEGGVLHIFICFYLFS